MQIDMKRVDPKRNMDRFYSVQLTEGLFGDHGVQRQWGRCGSWGCHRLDWYRTELEAKCALSQLVKQKFVKGYFLSSMPSRK